MLALVSSTLYPCRNQYNACFSLQYTLPHAGTSTMLALVSSTLYPCRNQYNACFSLQYTLPHAGTSTMLALVSSTLYPCRNQYNACFSLQYTLPQYNACFSLQYTLPQYNACFSLQYTLPQYNACFSLQYTLPLQEPVQCLLESPVHSTPAGTSTMLALVSSTLYPCRNQGGQLWSLTADSLLDYRDYRQWLLDARPSSSPLPPTSTEDEFQERSRQAWTYLLLQIVKV